MSPVCLQIEKDTLVTPAQGMATADMRLEINGTSFPTQNWNDNVLVVLNWWVEALTRLIISGNSAREVVHFMEGPYCVEINMPTPDSVGFRAVERSLKAIEVATGEESAKEFIRTVTSQSHEILSACEQRGWWSKDAENLKLSLGTLKNVTALFRSR